MNELKPCPFCGKTHQIVEDYYDGPLFGVDDDTCPMWVATLASSSKEELIRLYNTRPLEAALEAAARWIPVGERLPGQGMTVMMWINPFSYIPGQAKQGAYMPTINPDYPWRSTWDMATYKASDITHWMPIMPGPEVQG